MEKEKMDFVPKPDEMEYLIKISQMTDQTEIDKAEKEYIAQCDAYFDWLDRHRSKNNDQ